jgi:hypothetical protein
MDVGCSETKDGYARSKGPQGPRKDGEVINRYRARRSNLNMQGRGYHGQI